MENILGGVAFALFLAAHLLSALALNGPKPVGGRDRKASMLRQWLALRPIATILDQDS